MAQAESVSFKAGDILFNEKDRCNSLFVVRSGQVEVFKKNKDGEKIPLSIVNSGEYLGEMAIFADNIYSATAIALTDVVALKLPRALIEIQLKAAPPWLVALTKGLVQRLKSTSEIIRKHDIVDEGLLSAVKAIEENAEKAKKSA